MTRRIFFELDQLKKRLHESPEQRLADLSARLDLVRQRDDLIVEYATLLNLHGRHSEALDQLLDHTFHPWEGGEGKVSEQYVIAHLEMAQEQLLYSEPGAAIDLLEHARHYPDNLGEGKLPTAQENHLLYWLGAAYEDLGDDETARRFFVEASAGTSEPTAALYYNDQPPEMIFYQAKAKTALGDEAGAVEICRRLIAYGEEHMDDDVKMDYFAVSLPDFVVFDGDLTQRNRIHCHYMTALGHLGLGDFAEAAKAFDAVLALEPAHLGATLHRRGCGDS